MSKMLNDYSLDEERNLLKIIIDEVSYYIKNRNLSRSKLDEILKKYTGI